MVLGVNSILQSREPYDSLLQTNVPVCCSFLRVAIGDWITRQIFRSTWGKFTVLAYTRNRVMRPACKALLLEDQTRRGTGIVGG